MFLVDGARSFRRAHDLDRGTNRDRRPYDTVNARCLGPRPAMRRARATVSVNASSLSSARIWTSSVRRTPLFLFLLRAREDDACAEIPGVPELDLGRAVPRITAGLCISVLV